MIPPGLRTASVATLARCRYSTSPISALARARGREVKTKFIDL